MRSIRLLSVGTALIVLLAACVGIALASRAGGAADRSLTTAGITDGTLVPAAAKDPVDVAFLGDSYTYGTGAAVNSDGYAYLVAKAEHWTARIVGLPGSGYVRYALDTSLRISSGIGAVIAAKPKLVIIECGHNDADDGIDLSRVEPNAREDLRRLRAGLPHAKLVVLGPIWLTQTPSARALAVRDAIHAAQRQIPNSAWIDPIAQQWFTGTREPRSGDYRTMINFSVGHPNNVGYRHIANLLEADLKQLDVR